MEKLAGEVRELGVPEKITFPRVETRRPLHESPPCISASRPPRWLVRRNVEAKAAHCDMGWLPGNTKYRTPLTCRTQHIPWLWRRLAYVSFLCWRVSAAAMVHAPVWGVEPSFSFLPPRSSSFVSSYGRRTRSDELCALALLLTSLSQSSRFFADARRRVRREAEGGTKLFVICRTGGLERKRMPMLCTVAEVRVTATIKIGEVRESEVSPSGVGVPPTSTANTSPRSFPLAPFFHFPGVRTGAGKRCLV